MPGSRENSDFASSAFFPAGGTSHRPDSPGRAPLPCAQGPGPEEEGLGPVFLGPGVEGLGASDSWVRGRRGWGLRSPGSAGGGAGGGTPRPEGGGGGGAEL